MSLTDNEKLALVNEAIILLEPVPEDKWIEGNYTNYRDCCCALGHYMRLKSSNPADYSLDNCDGEYSKLNLIGNQLEEITLINDASQFHDRKTNVISFLHEQRDILTQQVAQS